MVHSSFKGVTAGTRRTKRHGARNSCNDANGYPVRCSGRYIASEDNEHYPASGRLVRLGLLIVADMKTLGSGTRNPSGSSSLS